MLDLTYHELLHIFFCHCLRSQNITWMLQFLVQKQNASTILTLFVGSMVVEFGTEIFEFQRMKDSDCGSEDLLSCYQQVDLLFCGTRLWQPVDLP